MAAPRILVVRLGAMGDIIHALPAVASLKQGYPGSHLAWVVKPQWIPLLKDNPFIDEIIPFQRTFEDLRRVWQRLRAQRWDVAVDLQGLVQSALIAKLANPRRLIGLHRSQARERLAAMLYSTTVLTKAQHRVDRYLELAAAAGGKNCRAIFPLPSGTAEGSLPGGLFVLACPLAGWGSKQWPLEHYKELASALKNAANLPLVVNGPPQAVETLRAITGAQVHVSGVEGLIAATRRAHAVIGVDSGPLHLAAALGKPGVAIYGPTDPASHGPYGGTIDVLRDAAAATSYQRSPEIAASMRAIAPDQVVRSLLQVLNLKPALGWQS